MRLPNFARDGLPLRSTQHFDQALDHAWGSVIHLARALVPRDSSSVSSCNDGTSDCNKPVGSNTETLPIVLGAVIPISCALVVFVILHRRYLKKQHLEDRDDPHKSLDFGMDIQLPTGKKNRKGVPEMTITDLAEDGPSRPKRAHGMSMDMGLGSPYLLPGGLQDSRESIHSMSRSMMDEHDPYRPVAFVRSSTESGRPPRLGDNSSLYSAANSYQSGAESARLLANAQRMSRTGPSRDERSNLAQNASSLDDLPLTRMNSQVPSAAASRKQSLSSESRTTPLTSAPAMNFSIPDRKSLPAPPPDSSASSVAEEMPLPPRSTSNAPPPPRKSSASPGNPPVLPTLVRESSQYGDDDIVETTINVPTFSIEEPRELEYDVNPDLINTGRFSIEMSNPSEQYPAPVAQRMSVMGVRPLPPDNLLADENPEQRANRIRSFYKEYFDDSKNPDDADWDAGYADGAIYDPETGSYYMQQKPFAQPMGRRAMTPPPRGAPRISGSDGRHQRHMSTMTGARGRMGPRGGPPAMPKKKLPPPKNLMGLPKPHKMGYDNAIASPIDFAPPTTFRDLQNGLRPDSPSRAYSPSVRAYTPLASSFDELQVMPSPHHLRKSGTFTGLDFAPPRLRAPETASDAGSIRSARSGISAMQMDAVRAGAYRVSRIPKDVVMAKDDIATQLRPKMSLISRA